MEISWFFPILTVVFCGWFVIMLLDSKNPSRKLRQQLKQQKVRLQDIKQKFVTVEEQHSEMQAQLQVLAAEWSDHEAKRQELLLKVNQSSLICIPAGRFLMGSVFEDSSSHERPAHAVYLNEYYIAPTPVTNQEYRDFVNCTDYKIPNHWQQGSYRTGTARHPVTNVTWKDAQAYAKWAGVRLPTEAEWEKAARGDDEYLYPWGPRWVESCCNSMNRVATTLPVDEFPGGRSTYGLWDTVGNAYEWCEDFYDKDYYKSSPDTNPTGPEKGEERVIRGGCYMETKAGVRVVHRAAVSGSYARDYIGFRIAMSSGR